MVMEEIFDREQVAYDIDADSVNTYAADTRRQAVRRKKRKRKRRKKYAGICIGVLLALTVAAAIYGAIAMTDPSRKLAGTWYTDIDITPQVAEHASDWLKSAAMGNQVDISDYIQDVSVRCDITFDTDGTWTAAMDEGSYAACRQRVNEELAAALKKLISIRFEAAARGGLDDDTAEAMVQEILGMSTTEYLSSYGPVLLPELSEMRADFDRNGIYTADRQTLTIDNDRIVEYLVSNRLLAVEGLAPDGSSVILTRLSTGGSFGENTDSETEAEEDGALPRYGIGSIYTVCENVISDIKDDVMQMADVGRVQAATVKHRILQNMPVHIDGGRTVSVKTIHYSYRNNRYVSLRDMASALSGTDAAFSVSVSSQEIRIKRGTTYTPAGGEDILFDIKDSGDAAAGDKDVSTEDDTSDDDGAVQNESQDDLVYTTEALKLNKLYIDDNECKYYTMTGRNDAGNTDVYMSITDLAMILGRDMYIEDDELYVDTADEFVPDISALEDAGFYHQVRSALIGDADTGEIFASHDEDTAVSIASTTKLMNYLCVMDAVSSGKINTNDRVSVSHEAQILSETADGVIAMKEGDGYTVEELLYGMLLPSSNECALALAEYIAGSEEAYVVRMNDKATELGLSDATIFYNCHGLPVYSDNIATSKLQNQMSAKDMFRLASYILAVYPQVTDITSTREYTIASTDKLIKNLNPMLYNLDGVNGLKTGTTNMAGSSLVASMQVDDASGKGHTIISVEFGAEDAATRNTVSELMLRYGASIIQGRVSGGDVRRLAADGSDMPASAEALIRLLLAYSK